MHYLNNCFASSSVLIALMLALPFGHERVNSALAAAPPHTLQRIDNQHVLHAATLAAHSRDG